MRHLRPAMVPTTPYPIDDRFNPLVRAKMGDEKVQAYAEVKSELTRFGLVMQQALADAVNGEVANLPGLPDILTHKGAFEVRTGWNTKNSKGVRGDNDILRQWCEDTQDNGYIVQILGEVRSSGEFPTLSTEEFLQLHGAPEGTAKKIFQAYREGKL